MKFFILPMFILVMLVACIDAYQLRSHDKTLSQYCVDDNDCNLPEGCRCAVMNIGPKQCKCYTQNQILVRAEWIKRRKL